ncbi:MAG: HAD-IB family phosphatase [Pseudomonadota bacterium]
MAHYPAVSVFEIDDTLIEGSLWRHVLRQVFLEVPTRAPRYMMERAFAGAADYLLRRPTDDLAYAQSALRLMSRISPDVRSHIIDYVVDGLVRENLRPGAIDTLIQRRKAGDRIFFVSDCFDFILAKLASRLGGADIIATRTFENTDGTLILSAGEIRCRGQQKLARLREHFDGERRPPFVRAYGHSSDDFILLSWADAGVAVNPEAKAVSEAQAMGLSVVDWSVGIKDAPLHRPVVPGTSQRSERQKSN